MIDANILVKYDGQFPRYTSYPTAPHFSDKVDAKKYETWLKDLPEKQNLSLYFHIPFCDKLCWYCGCYTTITKRYAPVENYVQILIHEIRLIADLIKEKNHKISHIHFGGGSPTILFPGTFYDLMHEVRSHFAINDDAEIAIEIDPRNINEEKIRTYAQEGINRASIGVQDFNDEVQKAINREQSFDVVYECVKLLRKHKIEKVNLDLIYGLPKQTVEMVKKNIDYSLLMNPDRIALFAYAHVKWKKKQMRLIDEDDLPESLDRNIMYQEAASKLEEEGYYSIGLDHFVKKNDSMFKSFSDGKIKRNFQGYSSDSADVLIGLGVSSISYLPEGYVQNTLDFESYKKDILSKKLPVIKGIEIAEDDKIRKKIIDELMCYMEVDLIKICESYNLDYDHFSDEIAALENLRKDGLVRTKSNKIRINLAAPQISRIICSLFDRFFESGQQKHSKI